jgi:transcription termination factor Rho
MSPCVVVGAEQLHLTTKTDHTVRLGDPQRWGERRERVGERRERVGERRERVGERRERVGEAGESGREVDRER